MKPTSELLQALGLLKLLKQVLALDHKLTLVLAISSAWPSWVAHYSCRWLLLLLKALDHHHLVWFWLKSRRVAEAAGLNAIDYFGPCHGITSDPLDIDDNLFEEW